MTPPTVPAQRPWPADRCPPWPLVLAGELCLPPGVPAAGALPVLADVLVVAPAVAPAHRAGALALLLPHRHGVVVRATAAWLWTGAADLAPARADLAVPPGAPALPGPAPAPDRSLAVRRTRWGGGAGWALVAGVGVTDPVRTTAECARLLPTSQGVRCVLALLGTGVDAAAAARLLRGACTGRASPPGTADALDLLAAAAA